MAALLTACQQQTTQTIQADWLIANVSVINTEDGTTLPNAYVAISGDRIDSVYTQKVTLADTTKVVDGFGKYLIPGLWDMHAHMSFDHRYATGLMLANGVTGAREMWGIMDSINYIRQGAEKGDFLAPDIFTSGTIIDGKPAIFPGMTEVVTEAEARAAVQEQADQGVDFIKVYSNLGKKAYMAIGDEVKKQGISMAGHIPEAINTFEAIAAGQTTAEHLRSIQLTSSTKADSLRFSPGLASFSPDKIRVMVKTFSQERFDAIIKAVAESNMWLVPTLVAKRNYVYLNDTIRFSPDPKRNPLIDLIPKSNVDYWKYLVEGMPMQFGDDFYAANQVRNSKDLALLPQMVKGGVKFMAGTDYGNPYAYPGYSLHEELEIFANNGMTNAQALKTATYSPAVFLGREKEMGTVEKGKMASLVLLNANPLANITNTKKIDGVFLKGTYLNRMRLDSLVEVSRYWAKRIGNEAVDNAQAYGISGACLHHYHGRQSKEGAHSATEPLPKKLKP